MNDIYPHAWLLGELISIDEMTIIFQGMHKDKRWITHKTKGNGFQCDALYNKGYTYEIYFRNHPAPENYLKLGMLPLHSRVLVLP